MKGKTLIHSTIFSLFFLSFFSSDLSAMRRNPPIEATVEAETVETRTVKKKYNMGQLDASAVTVRELKESVKRMLGLKKGEDIKLTLQREEMEDGKKIGDYTRKYRSMQFTFQAELIKQEPITLAPPTMEIIELPSFLSSSFTLEEEKGEEIGKEFASLYASLSQEESGKGLILSKLIKYLFKEVDESSIQEGYKMSIIEMMGSVLSEWGISSENNDECWKKINNMASLLFDCSILMLKTAAGFEEAEDVEEAEEQGEYVLKVGEDYFKEHFKEYFDVDEKHFRVDFEYLCGEVVSDKVMKKLAGGIQE